MHQTGRLSKRPHECEMAYTLDHDDLAPRVEGRECGEITEGREEQGRSGFSQIRSRETHSDECKAHQGERWIKSRGGVSSKTATSKEGEFLL